MTRSLPPHSGQLSWGASTCLLECPHPSDHRRALSPPLMGAPPNCGGRSLTPQPQLPSWYPQGDLALRLSTPFLQGPDSPGVTLSLAGRGVVCSPTRYSRGRREARCCRGASVADGSGATGSSCARCADAGPAGRSSCSLHPNGLSRRARRPAVPPRSASSRQRVRPRRLHWLRAPQPAIGLGSLFYIDLSGPIGVRSLLNMHAGHQSGSEGAGPPRAVAKLGLLNCY